MPRVLPHRPRADGEGGHADAQALRLARHAAQRVRHRPQPATRGRRRHARASSRCATGTSCAAFWPTRSATSATATSSSVRSPPRSRPASCSSPASRLFFGGGDEDRPNPFVAHRADDPGAGRRDDDPDGDHPQPRVRGRPLRRPSHRRRRTAGPGARPSSRPPRSSVPMDVTPAQATLFIINPLTGRKVQGRQLVPHAPADRGPHRPPPRRRMAQLSHKPDSAGRLSAGVSLAWSADNAYQPGLLGARLFGAGRRFI